MSNHEFDKNIDFVKIAILSHKVEFLSQSKIRKIVDKVKLKAVAAVSS